MLLTADACPRRNRLPLSVRSTRKREKYGRPTFPKTAPSGPRRSALSQLDFGTVNGLWVPCPRLGVGMRRRTWPLEAVAMPPRAVHYYSKLMEVPLTPRGCWSSFPRRCLLVIRSRWEFAGLSSADSRSSPAPGTSPCFSGHAGRRRLWCVVRCAGLRSGGAMVACPARRSLALTRFSSPATEEGPVSQIAYANCSSGVRKRRGAVD